MKLTADQKRAVERGEPVPVTVDDTECVVLRRDVYQKIKGFYDDSDWTAEEMQALAARTFKEADTGGPIP